MPNLILVVCLTLLVANAYSQNQLPSDSTRVSSIGAATQESISNTRGDDPLNVVLILTDDQSRSTLNDMPLLLDRIANAGIVFENAIVTNPSCSPSRASILSGGYHSRDTGVKSNSWFNGGLSHFDESRTIATALSAVGYNTGFVGKYLHGYKNGHVPPGWTHFVANQNGGMVKDFWSVSNVTYGTSIPGTEWMEVRYSEEPKQQYLTNFQTDAAINFLDNHASEPFFLFVSYYAPHPPFMPERPEDEKFGQQAVQPCVGEVSLEDKPRWFRVAAAKQAEAAAAASSTKWSADCGQASRSAQAAMLQSVDRGVDRLFEAVERLNLTERTVFFFMADNGIDVGHPHVFNDKGMPYEGSIGVPLVVFLPDSSAQIRADTVAANLDVPATILDIAEIIGKSDGLSLRPSLMGGAPLLKRDGLLIENYGYLNWRNTRLNQPLPPMVWAGIRTSGWKYIEYTNGDLEAYDLRLDPHETTNLAAIPSHLKDVERLRSMLAPMKGLAIKTTNIPPATVGKDYSMTLEAWGGTPPYAWRLSRGKLPAGLTFDGTTGTISGVASESSRSRARFEVEDTGRGRHSEKPEQFSWEFTVEVLD